MIFEQHLQKLEKAIPDILRELAIEARVYFDKSWADKGFTDTNLTPWKPVLDKNGEVKERPLVDTGALRRSLRTEVSQNVATIFTEIPYAQIHNEGGKVAYTANVREHTRKGSKVKAHTRTVDHDMPQRQFMGPSATLDKQLEKIITDRINYIINNP